MRRFIFNLVSVLFSAVKFGIMKRNVIDVIHYCSSSQISGNPHYVRESPRPFLTALCIPAGRLLTAYIRKKARTEG